MGEKKAKRKKFEFNRSFPDFVEIGLFTHKILTFKY